MKRRSKYWDLVRELGSQGPFTTADAQQAGVPKQALAHLCKVGGLERISRGHYCVLSDSLCDPKEELALTAASVPNGVICLISALHYYELTEEFPRAYWIAVPHSQKAPVRPHTRVVRMTNTRLGRRSIKMAGVRVHIFDPERSVVDAFRFLSQEIAIKALKMYLFEGPRRPDIPKLTNYARTLKVNIDPYLAALIT